MSTFKGTIAEFPRIRIDNFRQQPGQAPPLACFLSHVHSDHLVGLETLRAPFVYCSAATREILLRLEKYQYRLNYANGLLSSRHVTYDRSMRKLAKPLPLDTPTTLELAPGNKIRVCLIDANHCVGAVMFLIEGDGKAILYTGDIRAENWWVNSLVQNPVLLPYTIGNKRLNCMYLDTTFATKREPYREFPSKAHGIRELLEKVAQYPDDTIFYFHSWTYGYENVWIALSAFLDSRIHLDDYRASIYGSLSTLHKLQLREAGLNVRSDNKFLRESGLEVREAPALCGFRNGNHIQPGCLTSDEHVRIHSCERGMGCTILENDKEGNIVHIVPIISRINGVDMDELGAGGGNGDLDLKEELATDGIAEIGKLMELCVSFVNDDSLRSKVSDLLKQSFLNGQGTIDLKLHTDGEGEDDLSLQALFSGLSKQASVTTEDAVSSRKSIRFPYSRHSSFSELCNLIAAFRPQDVYPCTVDEVHWTTEVSMRNLFGQFCSGRVFRHDDEMIELKELTSHGIEQEKRHHEDTQCETLRSSASSTVMQHDWKRARFEESSTAYSPEHVASGRLLGHSEEAYTREPPDNDRPTSPTKGSSGRVETISESSISASLSRHITSATSSTVTSSRSINLTATPNITSSSRSSRLKHTNEELAYHAAIGRYLTWSDYGGLVSTRSKADRDEQEL